MSHGWVAWLPGEGVALLGWMAAATVVIFVLQWAQQATQAYLSATVGSRMIFHLGGALFDHLQRQSLRFHTDVAVPRHADAPDRMLPCRSVAFR